MHNIFNYSTSQSHTKCSPEKRDCMPQAKKLDTIINLKHIGKADKKKKEPTTYLCCINNILSL